MAATLWPIDPRLEALHNPSSPACFFFFLNFLTLHKHTSTYDKQTHPDTVCKNNLLHRGRGVQGGREVQALQAGRGYHLFQRGQRDPASREREGEKGNIRNLELLECRRATEQVQKSHVCSQSGHAVSSVVCVWWRVFSVYIHRTHKWPPLQRSAFISVMKVAV